MMLKQRRDGSALMPTSVRAFVMMACMAPRKKRAFSGMVAPLRASSASTALRSYDKEHMMLKLVTIMGHAQRQAAVQTMIKAPSK